MIYSVRIKASAAKAIRKLDPGERKQIIARIDQLSEHPYAGTILKGELSGLRRVRAGDFRIVYEVSNEELVVLVVRVAHRREVYRRG